MKPVVYLIDDNLVSQFAIKIVMEQSKTPSKVSCFDNAKEGLIALKKSIATQEDIPRIILLDLNMPVMNGWDFLDELEKLGTITDSIEIFIISSFTNTQDRNKAQNHPFVKGYFEKPLSKANIDTIVF